MPNNEMVIEKLTAAMTIIYDCVDVIKKGSGDELKLLRSYHKIAEIRNNLIKDSRNDRTL